MLHDADRSIAADEVHPTAAELTATARELVPLLRERAAEDERERRVSGDTIARMVSAGLFRVIQPRRWGGYELGQQTFADIQMTLAHGDMSVAWVYGVLGVHAYHLGLYDDRAASDVWATDSSLLISSPYMPGGNARTVPGGFLLSGRWSYSSGCDHCPWTFLGGFVDGDPSRFHSFLLPRSDARIVDTWHTGGGLAATGSHDIVVTDAFVPEYRTHSHLDGFHGNNPGASVNDGPLFRMPFNLVFMRCITNGQIGSLEYLVEILTEERENAALRHDPDVLLLVAAAQAEIAALKAVMSANFAAMEQHALAREMPPIASRHLFRFQSAQAADKCVQLAEQIGTHATALPPAARQKVDRILNNMRTGRQHAAANHRAYGRIFGDLLLGGEPGDILL